MSGGPVQRARIRTIAPSLALALAAALGAQTAAPAPATNESRGTVCHDSLFQQLVGDWTMTGAVKGKPVSYRMHAEWVLQHTFFRIEMQDAAEPSEYQAMVYIGYDNVGDRFVAHWIDVFGGRFSETLGYGKRDGNAITFQFDYPDAPFFTTFTRDTASDGFRLEMKDHLADGSWRSFASWRLVRR